MVLDEDEGSSPELDRVVFKNDAVWLPGQDIVPGMFRGPRRLKSEKLFKAAEDDDMTFEYVGPKIPKDLSDTVLSWMRRWGAIGETQGKLFFNRRTQEWAFEVFPQLEPRGMTTDEKPDDPRHDKLQEEMTKRGFTCYGSIHHHCQIGAFQSGTDEKDENRFNGIHVTFGHMTSKVADVHIRVVHEGITFDDVEAAQVFEDTEFVLSDDLPAYPKEWDERFVKRTIPTYSTNTAYRPYKQSYYQSSGDYLWDEYDYYDTKPKEKVEYQGEQFTMDELNYNSDADMFFMDMLVADVMISMLGFRNILANLESSLTHMGLMVEQYDFEERYVHLHEEVRDDLCDSVKEWGNFVAGEGAKSISPCYLWNNGQVPVTYKTTWGDKQEHYFYNDPAEVTKLTRLLYLFSDA
jgi:hypothetical protein